MERKVSPEVRKGEGRGTRGGARSSVRVVKASGEAVSFDPNVIRRECIDAGIDFWTAAEVALEVSGEVYDRISARTLQETVLETLRQKSPEAADRYQRYHSMYVRTSRHTIDSFDRKRIIASLLEETTLPQELAEVVAKESEEELRRLKIDFISAPLIREVINVKLLEHGCEEARTDYTRLGMPVQDARKLIHRESPGGWGGRPLHRAMAGNILQEYVLLKVLPLHLADAHMRGEFYIHSLEDFVVGPHSFQQDPRWVLKEGLRMGPAGPIAATLPPKTPESAVRLLVRMLTSASPALSGPASLRGVNVFLAPYLQGQGDREMSDLARLFLLELDHLSSLVEGLVPPLVGIEYGVPEDLEGVPAVLPRGETKGRSEYREFEEEARRFALALCQEAERGDDEGRALLTFRPQILLRPGAEEKEGYSEFLSLAHTLASRSSSPSFASLHPPYVRERIPLCEGAFIEADEEDLLEIREGSFRSGTLQVVTLNLPRIAYEARGDDERLFEVLRERLERAREVLEIKRETLLEGMEGGRLPYLGQRMDGDTYYPLGRVLYTVSYLGLNEMAKIHTGKGIQEGREGKEFGRRVLESIQKTLKEWKEETGLRWALRQTRSPTVSQRLAKLDLGAFGERAIVHGRVEEGVSYTPASWVPGEAPVPLRRRIDIEGDFQPLSLGGIGLEIPVKEGATGGDLLKVSQEILKGRKIASWTYLRGNGGKRGWLWPSDSAPRFS
jgi:ribonucleoside-triphosphate reductase